MQSLSLGPVRMATHLHIRVAFTNVLTRFAFVSPEILEQSWRSFPLHLLSRSGRSAHHHRVPTQCLQGEKPSTSCLRTISWVHADDAVSLLKLQECLQRSFKAEVYTCPACRHDLGKNYSMAVNKSLQDILNQLFPGYNNGRWSWVLSAKVMWMPDVNCKGNFSRGNKESVSLNIFFMILKTTILRTRCYHFYMRSAIMCS